jgi:hypothetical protein
MVLISPPACASAVFVRVLPVVFDNGLGKIRLGLSRAEKVATPHELYERPANMFVANFIGEPPMNLLPLRARDGRLALADAGWHLALDDRRTRLAQGANAERLTAGIRREHVLVGRGASDDRQAIVCYCEPRDDVYSKADTLKIADPEDHDRLLPPHEAATPEVIAGLATERHMRQRYPRMPPLTTGEYGFQEGRSRSLGVVSSVLITARRKPRVGPLPRDFRSTGADR